MTQDVPRDLALLLELRSQAGVSSLPDARDVGHVARPEDWPACATSWNEWWRYLLSTRAANGTTIRAKDRSDDLAALSSGASDQQLESAALARQRCVENLATAPLLTSWVDSEHARAQFDGLHLDIVDLGSDDEFAYFAGDAHYVISLSLRLNVEKLRQVLTA